MFYRNYPTLVGNASVLTPAARILRFRLFSNRDTHAGYHDAHAGRGSGCDVPVRGRRVRRAWHRVRDVRAQRKPAHPRPVQSRDRLLCDGHRAVGAGKSFATKLQLVRRAMYDEDTMIVMLDPLEGFAGLNDALGGEGIMVGGTRGLNPLEINQPDEATLQEADDLDPWSAQITKVMGFFEDVLRRAREQSARRAESDAPARRPGSLRLQEQVEWARTANADRTRKDFPRYC